MGLCSGSGGGGGCLENGKLCNEETVLGQPAAVAKGEEDVLYRL